MKTPPHLGGHCNLTHTDHGALKWARDRLVVTSVLDVGCGPGGQIQAAKSLGMEAMGIEGDPAVLDPSCMIHYDFGGLDSFADLQITKRRFGMAWCVEFLEHVHAGFLPRIFAAFSLADHVVCTAAPPGMPGHHHVNLQPERWWIERFQAEGWTSSEALTRELRDASTMLEEGRTRGRNPRDFIRERGMVFSRVPPGLRGPSRDHSGLLAPHRFQQG